MNGIKITGGIPLDGEIKIQGSKNAALPVMAAALLNKGVTVLHGCPRISDVFLMEELLQKLGAKTGWQGHTLWIDAKHISSTDVEKQRGEQMRSSIILMGSLLGRFGEASVPHPGGCIIGSRPINLHLNVLEAFGTVFREESEILYAKAEKLVGTSFTFPKVSVGATQNAVLAAVCAEGETVLSGCAREPEVSWLCRFLNRAGAKIQGIGESKLTIQGVRELHDVEFRIPADRIAAGTYVCASAATRGKGILLDAPVEEMRALLDAYVKIGGQYVYNSGKLSLYSLYADGFVKNLHTQVYPGFPTDLQSVFMTALACGKGESLLTETIFEDRFKIVSQLNRMGAAITVCENTAKIRGRKLKGARVKAEELRGAAALVVAGLAAEGETYVENRNFIERGYEDICRDFSALGARILKD